MRRQSDNLKANLCQAQQRDLKTIAPLLHRPIVLTDTIDYRTIGFCTIVLTLLCTLMFVNVHQVGLPTIIIFILHNHLQKTVPNCDVLFASGELRQAYGHVSLTMSA